LVWGRTRLVGVVWAVGVFVFKKGRRAAVFYSVYLVGVGLVGIAEVVHHAAVEAALEAQDVAVIVIGLLVGKHGHTRFGEAAGNQAVELVVGLGVETPRLKGPGLGPNLRLET
jgi:hypothetical protein